MHSRGRIVAPLVALTALLSACFLPTDPDPTTLTVAVRPNQYLICTGEFGSPTCQALIAFDVTNTGAVLAEDLAFSADSLYVETIGTPPGYPPGCGTSLGAGATCLSYIYAEGTFPSKDSALFAGTLTVSASNAPLGASTPFSVGPLPSS